MVFSFSSRVTFLIFIGNFRFYQTQPMPMNVKRRLAIVSAIVDVKDPSAADAGTLKLIPCFTVIDSIFRFSAGIFNMNGSTNRSRRVFYCRPCKTASIDFKLPDCSV